MPQTINIKNADENPTTTIPFLTKRFIYHDKYQFEIYQKNNPYTSKSVINGVIMANDDGWMVTINGFQT